MLTIRPHTVVDNQCTISNMYRPYRVCSETCFFFLPLFSFFKESVQMKICIQVSRCISASLRAILPSPAIYIFFSPYYILLLFYSRIAGLGAGGTLFPGYSLNSTKGHIGYSHSDSHSARSLTCWKILPVPNNMVPITSAFCSKRKLGYLVVWLYGYQMEF